MLHIFKALDARRRELGMPYAVLAERSQISLPTVVRILSGKNPTAAFANVWAIAQALRMWLKCGKADDSGKLLETQAQKKARQLVGLVQGTAGLEGQAVGKRTLDRMKRKTVHELLAGSRRKLWSR